MVPVNDSQAIDKDGLREFAARRQGRLVDQSSVGVNLVEHSLVTINHNNAVDRRTPLNAPKKSGFRFG